jgi:hypothetical protein
LRKASVAERQHCRLNRHDGFALLFEHVPARRAAAGAQLSKAVNPKAKSKSPVRSAFRATKKLEKLDWSSGAKRQVKAITQVGFADPT